MTRARAQSLGEEIANSISHGLGLLLAVASLPILLHFVAQREGAAGALNALSVSLFCGTMILLYAASTVYHALPAGRAKQWFNRIDHAAIYLFIAGSYMPYLLGVLRGPAGLARCWRPGLHPGRGGLPLRRAPKLRPPGLASARSGRERLPFRRGVVADGLRWRRCALAGVAS